MNTDDTFETIIRMGFSHSRVMYVNYQKFASSNHQVSHYLDKAILMMYILL